MHEYLIGICICFSYVCHIPIQLNGFHDGGGVPPYRYGGGRRPPPLVGWESGKRKKNICKYLSNIRAFKYPVDFIIFSLRFPRSYLFSEIQYPVVGFLFIYLTGATY